jgi:hypothetical protein
MADGAQAQGWIDPDGTWRLQMEGSFDFSYQSQDEFEERALLVFFRQFRTPQSTPKRPFLRQEWLAEWFDTHQELISRWQGYVRQGGLLKLRGKPEGWVLTPQLRQAILDIWGPHCWLSAGQVRERLLAAGHMASLQDISEPRIHQVAQESGLAEVRRLLRQMLQFTADGPQWRDAVLIQRRNPVCPFTTFTDYPAGVRLYSGWTVETMIWGVMVYMQMRTTYRRGAEAVGVSPVTLWCWAMIVGWRRCLGWCVAVGWWA